MQKLHGRTVTRLDAAVQRWCDEHHNESTNDWSTP